ncbi:beta-lactamase family protein [Antarcticibacterium sp. 1MA-6-2]|uniref:serine hydrolase domain-containing protein n=1 Tax=Antarcticibacterium sp. 1MA-6-2 TaxID=2908210 RepID=UPI001F3A78E3|nr:serine hydrolase domain-containing protein [Antarcticibacterium sp. 1MA-6-2]UJH91710.1 beta-lactamase family protein [Antarcticibacterium sp. 1MA-6-2]
MVGQQAVAQETQLNSIIQSYATKNNFNGTVLVEKDSAILFHKSFGIADRRFNIPINNETVYKIASITKAFTAVLILQLHEQGELDLNKPIKNYLPDYPDEVSLKVTPHQLLNHTSGIILIDTVSSVENAMKYGLGLYSTPNTTNQLLKSFINCSLVNEPGSKFNYNNAEYFVLGKIIEALYQKTYEKVLNEKILEPLGMTTSGMATEKDIIRNLASTYFSENNSDSLINDIPMFIENWYAAGAMYSSPPDLLKFSNALFGLKLINKENLDLMLTPGLDDYGYGVWIKGKGDERVMERYGSIMGLNAVWMRHLNKSTTIIILSNTNLTNLGNFASEIGSNVP